MDVSANVMVNSGVVGAQLPIAVGFALASQLRDDKRVTVCTFGDGAVNQGAFHESLNLASLWSLPIVFICHNNGYAEKTAFDLHCASEKVVDRAAAYGDMAAALVDGDDVLATYEAVSSAIARARNGLGPTLIEATCYRQRGHFIGDIERTYLPDGELAAMIAADPVPRFRELLLAEGFAGHEVLDEIDAQARREVDLAWDFASESPFPSIDEVTTQVYAEVSP
jgi:pyruvate dehydrogenase E1 component alpha subunit